MLLHSAKTAESIIEPVVFTLDLAGNFKFVNSAGELVSGYRCEELRRLNVRDLLPGIGTFQLTQYVRRAMRRRCGAVFEIEVTARYGRRVSLEVSLALIKKADRSREFECIAIPLEDWGRVAPSRPRCLDSQFTGAENIASFRLVR